MSGTATRIAHNIRLVGTFVLIWSCILPTVRQVVTIPGATLHIWAVGGTGAGIAAAIAAAAFIPRMLGASTVVPIPIKTIIPASARANFPAAIRACCAWCALYGCDNIHSWIPLSGDLAFSHQDEIYGFKFPKRFLEISSRDLTLLSILII
jgi:hypothetical protein